MFERFINDGFVKLAAAAGMRRLALADLCREWDWLVRHMSDLYHSRAQRAIWLIRLAMRTGRIFGSIKSRVIYL